MIIFPKNLLCHGKAVNSRTLVRNFLRTTSLSFGTSGALITTNDKFCNTFSSSPKYFSYSLLACKDVRDFEQQDLIAKQFIEKKINFGLNAHLGVKVVHVKLSNMENDRENAFIEMSMPITEVHMNAMGLVHGGSIITMSDTAIGTGAFFYAHEFLEGAGMVVLDTFTQFTRHANINDVLHVVARPRHLGRKTQTWEATIYLGDPKENIKAAHTISTVLNLPNEEGELLKSGNLKKLGKNFNINTMNKEEIAARFDKYSEQWEFLTKISEYQKNVIAWVLKQANALKQQRTLDNLKVLDLATGCGLVGNALCNVLGETTKLDLTGLDISQGMLNKSEELGVYRNLFVHDLDTKIDRLQSNSFDLITCFGVTEMLQNLETVLLPEIKRLLKKSNSSQCWISFQYNDGNQAAAHQGMRTFNEEEIVALLKKNNLKVIQLEILKNAYLLPDTSGSVKPVPFCMVTCCHDE
ncbi:hypothetical protein C9374_003135 [Naegleria lovaniensis]|uniref:Methyltransferase domain-containing protein n=1 Tax=Naegleria lovaniensis TaxID=51637 RepID=A0AA88GUE6_NAELO|nr:uncharacterized protein C9374_003135 [Naegleria lovaniensis]KAG2385986.1 hypothetical protein C9374_003135 [Naegleria lovaniensis]